MTQARLVLRDFAAYGKIDRPSIPTLGGDAETPDWDFLTVGKTQY
jgi:hypothetical protein